MDEFIKTLIERLEELQRASEDDYSGLGCDDDFGAMNAYGHAIDIVNQLAEEYSHRTEDLVIEDSHRNDGWIPVSERLPEEKENPITHDYLQYPVMVKFNETVDMRYYYYGNGHWRHGFQIMDKYVTHWMDIKPYQPKGE